MKNMIDSEIHSNMIEKGGYMGKADILVVESKIRKYIKEKSDCSTSPSAIEGLSDKVRELCDKAIENALQNDRKTVKDKDFA